MRPGLQAQLAVSLPRALHVSLLAAGLSGLAVWAAEPPQTQTAAAAQPKRAEFKSETASAEARRVANWIAASGDNRGLPYLIVDKVQAQVFVFDAQGRLLGASPALLGLALGDDSVPGIGDRALSSIRTFERTTPAGRFVASLDRDLHGNEVLWVDYDTGVALHRVGAAQTPERREHRLATPTPADNRITFGCINVPSRFYDSVVRPALAATSGIVYVLPETRPARAVFGIEDAE